MTVLDIFKVSGSPAVRGHGTAKVTDTSPDTYFSSVGAGAYLDLELQKEQRFDVVSLGFFEGNRRRTIITINPTDDFEKFGDGHVFTTSGITTSPQDFHLPPGSHKGVRITFNGHVPGKGAPDDNALSITAAGIQSIQTAVAEKKKPKEDTDKPSEHTVTFNTKEKEVKAVEPSDSKRRF